MLKANGVANVPRLTPIVAPDSTAASLPDRKALSQVRLASRSSTACTVETPTISGASAEFVGSVLKVVKSTAGSVTLKIRRRMAPPSARVTPPSCRAAAPSAINEAAVAKRAIALSGSMANVKAPTNWANTWLNLRKTPF